MSIDWSNLWDKGTKWVDKNKTAIGVAGQIANQELAVKALEDAGDDAQEFIGMPAGQSLYDTVAGDTRFKPFTVSSVPGTMTTTAAGDTTFALSPEQKAIEQSLRTGGSTLMDAVLGRGQYGTINPATGLPEQNLRSGQADLMNMLQVGDQDALGRTYRDLQQQGYIGANQSLTDPFSAENLAATEQSAFDRMQAMRAPANERAQLALNQNLFNQGRMGLQTAQFGGSPEQLALSKAMQEQQSADAVAAMGLARQDAQMLANQRAQGIGMARDDQSLRSQQSLAAMQQLAAEKELGANIGGQMIQQSYAPQGMLLQSAQPSLNIADMATTAGRQLGQYGLGMGQTALDYDMQAKGGAVNLRNQTMKGLFDLLIAQETADANRDAAALSGGSSNSEGNFFENLLNRVYPYQVGSR